MSQFSFLDDMQLYGDKTPPKAPAPATQAPPLRGVDARQAVSSAEELSSGQTMPKETQAQVDCVGDAALNHVSSALLHKINLLERQVANFERFYSASLDEQFRLQRSLLSCQTSSVWLTVAILVLLCILAWKTFAGATMPTAANTPGVSAPVLQLAPTSFVASPNPNAFV